LLCNVALVDQDREHLRLLTIFYYVCAALEALFGCIPIIHLVLGVVMIAKPDIFGGNNPPPAFLGYLFAIMGGAFVLAGWALAFCTFLAGRFLSQRKHWLFCLIVAGASCAFTPFGTALGVFTFIVLLRPGVKAMFS
jgi:hypothetical protein